LAEAEQERKVIISDHWQCPSCKTIFEKGGLFEAAEQMYQAGVGISLGSPIHCPECKENIDAQAFFDGKYDHKLHQKPSSQELESEARSFFQRLILEEIARSRGRADNEAVARNATNRTAEALFQKYGLTQAEVIELFRHIL
jgi:hypothetical protein